MVATGPWRKDGNRGSACSRTGRGRRFGALRSHVCEVESSARRWVVVTARSLRCTADGRHRSSSAKGRESRVGVLSWRCSRRTMRGPSTTNPTPPLPCDCTTSRRKATECAGKRTFCDGRRTTRRATERQDGSSRDGKVWYRVSLARNSAVAQLSLRVGFGRRLFSSLVYKLISLVYHLAVLLCFFFLDERNYSPRHEKQSPS